MTLKSVLNTRMKVTILGCGASAGVPCLHRGWGICDPENPKNFRTRTSIILEKGDVRLLVDMSPDLRQQLLRYGSNKIDAVIFTHEHYDHVNGINELRPVFLESGRLLPIYAVEPVMEKIKKMFFYLFEDGDIPVYKPYISANILDNEFSIGDFSGICFPQNHGFSNSTGIRIGNFAYSTDVISFDESDFSKLEGLEVWIVECYSREKTQTHANLDMVMRWVEELRPKMTYLTHMGVSMDYDTLCKDLPDNVRPSYDGMNFIVE